MLALKNVSVAYGKRQVVFDAGFSLERGEIGCLLGPSGCGKTTIMRAIAGFEHLVQGSVSLHDSVVSSSQLHLAPEKRQVAMVFQDFALFPHLSVSDNIAFGLKNASESEKHQRVEELLVLIGLPDIADRFPHELSGGQQQRVALARALAPKPELILLDEPFSSLDADLREGLAKDIRSIIQQEGATALLVTHDQHEAFAMADHIGVMKDGRIHQWGSAYDIYHKPTTRFVADFIGAGVFLEGKVNNAGKLVTALGEFPLSDTLSSEKSQHLEMLVRPDDITHDDSSEFTAKVMNRTFKGAHIMYDLQLNDGTPLLCLAPSHHDHQVGENIGIVLDIEHTVAFALAADKT